MTSHEAEVLSIAIAALVLFNIILISSLFAYCVYGNLVETWMVSCHAKVTGIDGLFSLGANCGHDHR